MAKAARPIRDRIKDLIIQADCWEWQGSLNGNGYGQMYIGSRTDGSRRNTMAHRVSYETFVGEIPEGLVIDHLCRNKRCVNPAHLEAVTNKVNSQDRAIYSKRAGRFTGKTHCNNCGDKLVVVDKIHNWKGCLACRRACSLAWQAQKKGLQV